MSTPYRARLRRLQSRLKETGPSALLLSSAHPAIRSRDTAHPYRAESDLFYLTGSHADDVTLLVSSELKNPLLISPPVSEHRRVWEGEGPSMRALAKSIGAEHIETEKPELEAKKRLHGVETLFYQNTHATLGWKVARDLQALTPAIRGRYPAKFHHIDTLLGEMRLIKDAGELKAIRAAAELTAATVWHVLPQVAPGMTEIELAHTIDYLFRINNGEPAFKTIVASGPSAAVLHHSPTERKLKAGELLLVDCGAELNMYAADVTRVIPVGMPMNALQREMYDIVLSAQRAAIKAIRPGASVKKIQEAAVREITAGLVSLGVLRGKVGALVQKRAYLPYFPHGIGHTLGLDVHDVGRMRGDEGAVLREGMVITIEPGLYFREKTKHIPASGIRIEDDVYVKRGAPEILTKAIPTEALDIEEMLAGE